MSASSADRPEVTAADVHTALREAPIGDLDDIVDWPALVLAPHPDDESLAFGGLIAEACSRGREVFVVILTDGSGSHPGSPTWPPTRLAALRVAEATEAISVLGLSPERISFMGVRDTAAPTEGPEFDALIERLASDCHTRSIRTLLTCWRHDPHCDHEAGAILATEVCRLTGARHFEAPVWGWTLAPGTVIEGDLPRAIRLDVSRHRATKRRAIGAHRSQTTRMIDDARNGFLLEPSMIGIMDQPHEYLLAL